MHNDILLLVLLAACMHAIWNFVARAHSGNYALLWASFLLGGICLLPLAGGMIVVDGFDQLIKMQGLKFLLLSGLIHAFYMTLLARAYQYGDISTVYPISRGTGIGLTAIFAAVLLHEYLPLHALVGIGIILVGILALSFPGLRRLTHFTPVILALGVSLTIMSYSLTDKIGVGYINPIIYISMMNFITVLFMLPIILLAHHQQLQHVVRTKKRYIAIIGIGSIVTYLLILFAFRLGNVSQIVALRESSVIIAAILGFVFLKERPTFIKIAAIMIIFMGVILVQR